MDGGGSSGPPTELPVRVPVLVEGDDSLLLRELVVAAAALKDREGKAVRLSRAHGTQSGIGGTRPTPERRSSAFAFVPQQDEPTQKEDERQEQPQMADPVRVSTGKRVEIPSHWKAAIIVRREFRGAELVPHPRIREVLCGR